MAEKLPARVHETTPPDDPTDLLGYYEAVAMEAGDDAAEAVVRMGLAIRQIKDRELWRLTHDTFTGYLRDRWSNWSIGTVYRRLAWANALRELNPEWTDEDVSGFIAGTSELPGQDTFAQRESLPSVRSIVESKRKPRPPQGKAEAVDASTAIVAGRDDTQSAEVQPSAPAHGTSPSPSGAVPARGATVPDPPRQLALFGTVDLLGEIRDRALVAESTVRHALAVRLRSLAAEIDRPTATPRSREVVSNLKGKR